MLSRVAESIYWMSRYIERAENVARFLSVNLSLSLDLPGAASGADQQWWPLVATTGDAKLFNEHYQRADRESVMAFLTFDQRNPNSILSCLLYARENARGVREVISAEMWEHLNRFYLMVRDIGGLSVVLEDPYAFFEKVNLAGQQFLGVTDATMTHGEGWHFCRLGRSLERADKTSRILDVKYLILLPTPEDIGTPYDDIQWLALLRSASALEMYRQRHGRISPTGIVDFLVLDEEFPRAVLHCLSRANESLHRITGTPLGSFSSPAEQRLGQLQSDLAYSNAEDIITGGLHEYIDNLQGRLNVFSESVHDTFFAMRALPMA